MIGNGASTLPRLRAAAPAIVAALALVAASILLWAAPPAAQASSHVLVSNIGQTGGEESRLTTSTVQLQRFTTGSASGGYTLSSIEAVINNAPTQEAGRNTIRAELWSGNNVPGSKLYDLVVPAHPISAGTVSFAAPENTTLAASTNYFFVIYTTGDLNLQVETTTSNDEDAGGAAGWDIHNAFHSRHANLPTDTPNPPSPEWQRRGSTNSAMKIRVSGQTVPTVAFSPTSIDDQTYIVGIPVNQIVVFSGNEDEDAPKLPEATLSNPPANMVNYLVSYSAANLPAGLTVGQDRVIRGTPTTVTTGAVTVTYTATITAQVDPNADGDYTDVTTTDYTGTLTFTVTVNANPPVTFSEEASRPIYSGVIWWDNANASWVEKNLLDNNGMVTFPEAQGGTGTLTYSLIETSSGQPLAEVREGGTTTGALTGITFDATTRKLGGTPATWAQKVWAVQYRAEDENGNRAALNTQIYAGGQPGGL